MYTRTDCIWESVLYLGVALIFRPENYCGVGWGVGVGC